MTQPFPQKITDAMPPDNEMVIGTVVSGNPLTVNVRGGEQMPGRLSTTGLTAGDPVVLLREDATWLALGKVIAGTATGLGLTSLNWAQASAILGLTAVEQSVVGTTIDFTTTSPAASVVAVWFVDYEVIAASTATAVTMLRMDGVTSSSPAATWKQLVNTERGTTGNVSLTTVGPGSHTAVLRANRVGGADGQVRIDNLHTTLFLAVFE